MTKTRSAVLPENLPPRGLMRMQAAAWVNVSASTFDRMVEDGRMPRPRQIGRRLVWDLRELNEKFDALPHAGEDFSGESENPWDNHA